MSSFDSLPRFDENARPSWSFEAVPSGSGLGQRLIEVHNRIRHETEALLGSVAEVMAGTGTPETARSALQALSVRQNYPALGGFCSGYCELLTIHHTLEDQKVFPGLGRAHPDLQPILKQLYDEHEVVAELIRLLDEALAAPAGDRSSETLKTVSGALAERLLSHLLYEESQLVAVLDATPGDGPRP
jgi:hypothetical protein